MTTATATPASLIAEAQRICDEVEADRSPVSIQDRALIGYQLAHAVGEITTCGLLNGGWLDWDDLGGDQEDPPMAAAERALDAAKAARNRLAEAQRRAAKTTTNTALSAA